MTFFSTHTETKEASPCEAMAKARGQVYSGIGGQAVRWFHPNVVEIERGGVEIIFHVGGDEISTKFLIYIDARHQGRQEGDRH